MEELVEQTKAKMQKCIEGLLREFAAIRSGRVSPNLLDNIQIDLYGQSTPISSAASVTVSDSTTLLVTIWDVSNVNAVDTAIRSSSLGLNPRVEGNKLYIALPPLTAERRQEFIKISKQKAENYKVSVRNIRRDANDELKKAEKNNEMSEDDLKRETQAIQNMTDEFIAKVDSSFANKKKDLETV